MVLNHPRDRRLLEHPIGEDRHSAEREQDQGCSAQPRRDEAKAPRQHHGENAS
jgi:hypothetical protein